MGIPMRRKDKLLEKLTKEYNEWFSLDRNRHLETQSMKARLRNFIEKLDKKFDVKPTESPVKLKNTRRSKTPETSRNKFEASSSDIRKRSRHIETAMKIRGFFDKRGRFVDPISDMKEKSNSL